MMRLAAGMAGLGLLAPVAIAADLSGLYDQATLEEWQPRYERSTTRILEQVIAPALLTREKQRLGNVRLDFRLYGEGRAREHPLQFYVPPDGSRVVLPVASLKFLDDLCIAYAWLHINGYSLETVAEYTSMLRYKRSAEGRYPRPLEALGVPADALEDKRVDELALGHFVTARTFILLHELGHIINGHAGSMIANEKAADRFAAEVMRRTPLPPLGIIVLFLFDAHWASYPPGPNDTHPMSGERLQALAAALDDRALAAALAQLGAQMDDPDIRAGFAATGAASDLAALAPRRPGELPRRQTKAAIVGAAGVAFQGRYVGQSVQFGELAPFPIDVVLQRRGERVDGSYSFGLGIGTISGKAVGDTLIFDWVWAGNFGRGTFKTSSDGSGFTGSWGYRESSDNGGTWNGRRVD